MYSAITGGVLPTDYFSNFYDHVFSCQFVPLSRLRVTFDTDSSVESHLDSLFKVRRMCLAIPGQIIEVQEIGGLRAARVQFGGIVRQVCLDFVPEAHKGDYVMVHVGFAITKVDRLEAERTFKVLQEMGGVEDELASSSSELP
jgi:hydrogenase expression/formation protein HypC